MSEVLELVNPSTLIVAENVRKDTKLTKAFLASIKTRGVLIPIVVDRTEAGLEVIDGQRRTLAAVEVGLKDVPVYVTAPLQGDKERIVDQLVMNDQRESISEAESVGAVKQLELFGMPLSSIVKKTGYTKAAVETALAVAGNEKASEALSAGQMTLDQAAVLVEFDGDRDATRELTKAAADGGFDHVAAKWRQKSVDAANAARFAEELVSEVATVLLPSDSSYKGLQDGDAEIAITRFDRLGKPSDATVPLELGDVAREHLAGRVTTDYTSVETGYRRQPAKQYFVVDAEANGYPARVYDRSPVRELTPEEQAAAEQRETERLAAAERREAFTAAAVVRSAWLVEFFQRPKLPKDALLFVAHHVVTTQELFNYHGPDAVIPAWLGIPMPEDDGGNYEAEGDGALPLTSEVLVNHLTARGLSSAERVLLAVAAASAEHDLYSIAVDSYRVDDLLPGVRVWLSTLASWGYELSDVEQSIVTPAAAA